MFQKRKKIDSRDKSRDEKEEEEEETLFVNGIW